MSVFCGRGRIALTNTIRGRGRGRGPGGRTIVRQCPTALTTQRRRYKLSTSTGSTHRTGSRQVAATVREDRTAITTSPRSS